MHSFPRLRAVLGLLCLAGPAGPGPLLAADSPVTRARYLVLTVENRIPPPLAAVDVVVGPRTGAGDDGRQWWQIEGRGAPEQETAPQFVVRVLADGSPFDASAAGRTIDRYLLRLPETGEVYEYRDRHTGRALLPPWAEFQRGFLPRGEPGAARRGGVPETCRYLGQVLTLHHVGPAVWESWDSARVLSLDPELLVGTGRQVKDAEGRRLPQQPERQNYTYVPFEEADYRTMIQAGINLFTIEPRQETWVRGEPVFYLRRPGGRPPLRYPADLYRANYLGNTMFMDEPSILMVGDERIHKTLRHFTDAAALIEARTRATYLSASDYGAYALERALRTAGVNFGEMRLMTPDLPSWETLYETAHYQMKGGGAGIVHEGRYQVAAFDEAVQRFTGVARKHTGREVLLWHYAFLRGGAGAFAKAWGTAIYGQCDPDLAPGAVTLAYDEGARYVWFWTSDHDHHVPWPEQLALARTLRDHAASRPRPSIRNAPLRVDTAIVIPAGRLVSLENLWWVRELDPAGQNEASQRFRHLMSAAIAAFHECLAGGRRFDFVVDEGREFPGYNRVIRLPVE